HPVDHAGGRVLRSARLCSSPGTGLSGLSPGGDSANSAAQSTRPHHLKSKGDLMPEQTATTGESSTTTASKKTEDRSRTEGRPEATQIIGAGLWPAPANDRYLLGTLRGAHVSEQDFEQLVARLAQDPDVHTLKEIKPSTQTAILGGGL